MCSARNRSAFTLLEVMVAVAIVGLITFTIYRFVEGTLTAIQISTEHSGDEAAMHSLSGLLQSQMNNLPAGKQGALLGEPNKSGSSSSDVIHWICAAGNGLLTKNADGEFKVSLIIRAAKDSEEKELALRQASVGNKSANPNTISLLKGVEGIEFRYFDPRQNIWLDKWQDPISRPTLVRMRVWRAKNPDPYEVVLTIPRTNAAG